jgi:hypothetical protein
MTDTPKIEGRMWEIDQEDGIAYEPGTDGVDDYIEVIALADAQKRVAELEAEIEELCACIGKLEKELNKTEDPQLTEAKDKERQDLIMENERLREALEYYAKDENWSVRKTYDCDVEGVIDQDDLEWSKVMHTEVGGKKAREALKETV